VSENPVEFTHVYVGARGTDPRWIGRPCRVLIRAKPPAVRNALVVFDDGSRVVVPTYAGGRTGATLRRLESYTPAGEAGSDTGTAYPLPT